MIDQLLVDKAGSQIPKGIGAQGLGSLGDRTKWAVRHQVPEESTQSTVYVTVSLPKNLCQKLNTLQG